MLAGDPDRPALSGNLKVASGDAAPLLQLLALTLPDMSARLPADFGGRLDWTPISWRLDRLSGTVNGGAISGRLSRPTNAATIQGALAVDRLPIAALSRTVLGPDQPLRVGANWSDATFGQPLADPPRMEIDLKASRVDVSDTLTGSNAAMQLTLAPGALVLDRLSMRLASGRVDGNVTLRREQDNVALSGRLAFDRIAIEKFAFGALITGSLEFASSGKSEASMAAGLAGAGEIGLANLRLNNLDPSAVPRVLALSDDEKIGLEGKDVDAALSRELDRAPFRSSGEIYFDAALASGVLRLSPRSSVAIGQMRTSLQPNFDTRSNGLDVQANISLAAVPRGWNGPAPQIAVTMSGLLAKPARRIESGNFVAGLTARAVQREADRIAAFEFDIKERAFFNRRLRWDRARQEERDRAAAEQARAEQERIESERRAAADAEAARRRAESAPPVLTPPPVSAPAQRAPAPPSVGAPPSFRAPTANQDPSSAGRY